MIPWIQCALDDSSGLFVKICYATISLCMVDIENHDNDIPLHPIAQTSRHNTHHVIVCDNTHHIIICDSSEHSSSNACSCFMVLQHCFTPMNNEGCMPNDLDAVAHFLHWNSDWFPLQLVETSPFPLRSHVPRSFGYQVGTANHLILSFQ